jgi:hypothetical protein
VSFAKNASADMSLRGNAFITVMQAAELRDLDDPSPARDSPRKWTLLVEAQMGPRSVVVEIVILDSDSRGAGLLTTGWACSSGSPNEWAGSASPVNMRPFRFRARLLGLLRR